MDIVNFFETLAGKWFSQRTVHDLSLQKSRAGQSDLEIDWLTKDHGDVMALCSQANVDAASALGGLRVGQNSLMEGDTQRYSASTLMVVLQPSGDRGQLLRQPQGANQPPISGYYTLENDILVLVSEGETFRSEERIWFANPNLRMRTNVLETADGIQTTAFCSEIRRGVTRPPQPEQTSQTSA